MEFEAEIEKFVREELVAKDTMLVPDAEMPSPTFRKFCELKLGNFWIAKELGGRGLTLKQCVNVISKLAYGDCGIANAALTSILSSRVIEIFGSDEQKQRFLVPHVKGGNFSALAGSEREAGSELLRITTSAKRDGANFVVNGSKFFCTNAGFADFVTVIAAVPEDEDFKAIVVPKGTPGMKFDRRWKTNGLQSSGIYGIQFENCTVPVDNALEGNGLRILEVGLNASRILIASTGIGISRRIMDTALEYAGKKTIKGQSMLDNAVFAAKLGQMEMEIEAMTSICNSAAEQYDEIYQSGQAKATLYKKGILKYAVVSKMLCGQLGWNVASVGSELFGGLGYTKDSLMGKLLNDMKNISIIEGGDDVCREILYGRFVKTRTMD